jgi:hypothetical protein
VPIIRRNDSIYAGCVPDSHPHRITSTKCRIKPAVSPDDGHIVDRSMSRLINTIRLNILRINYVPSWLYLQDEITSLGKEEKFA